MPASGRRPGGSPPSFVRARRFWAVWRLGSSLTVRDSDQCPGRSGRWRLVDLNVSLVSALPNLVLPASSAGFSRSVKLGAWVSTEPEANVRCTHGPAGWTQPFSNRVRNQRSRCSAWDVLLMMALCRSRAGNGAWSPEYGIIYQYRMKPHRFRRLAAAGTWRLPRPKKWSGLKLRSPVTITPQAQAL